MTLYTDSIERVITVKKSLVFALSLCAAAAASAANLAVPAAQVGDGRVSFGASYVAVGADITNDEIPLTIGGIIGHVSYAPVRYVNFGLDFGTARVGVDAFLPAGADTVRAFDGDFGWSAGGHLKLATPYFWDVLSILGAANGNFFRSTNKAGAYYGGVDAAAALGIQFRIPNGALTIGPQLYLILGENKGISGDKNTYTNLHNARVWLAYDFIPDVVPFGGDHKPYVSIEFTAAPKIDENNNRPSISGFSVSLSVGAIAADRPKSKPRYTESYIELKELEQEIAEELQSEYDRKKKKSE